MVVMVVNSFQDKPGKWFRADNTYQPVTVAETYRTNYLYLTFSDNGVYELETEYYAKEFDSGNSTCDNLKYTEETELYKETGVWTYDNVSKMLTVVTEGVDGDGQKYTDIFKLGIELVNGKHTANPQLICTKHTFQLSFL